MILPISELFTSPQGEGVHSGTLMTFIRTAGCCVGKPYKLHERNPNVPNQFNIISSYQEKCTLYDGREFPCDTDYQVHKRMTTEEIIKEIPWTVKDVCITGGEPLIHNLLPLVDQLKHEDKMVHLETSGTRPYLFPAQPKSGYIWVTVSPKHGCLKSMIDAADELKFLVDKGFNPDDQIETYPEHTLYSITDLAHFVPTFLQPVNGEWDINPENLQLCLDWQRLYPQFRISLQGHKVMSHFLKEVVR